MFPVLPAVVNPLFVPSPVNYKCSEIRSFVELTIDRFAQRPCGADQAFSVFGSATRSLYLFSKLLMWFRRQSLQHAVNKWVRRSLPIAHLHGNDPSLSFHLMIGAIRELDFGLDWLTDDVFCVMCIFDLSRPFCKRV
jgi:hypothetical protein